MIYDCFPFFNELDLLEIRLQELDPVVDKFVLVESTRNFQKKHKPLYFNENKERFETFLPKIIHIVVDKFPSFWHKLRIPNTWDYSNHQKEKMAEGLKNCKPQDIVIVSDVDEIPKAEKVVEYAQKKGTKVFEQRFYNYYLNCICTYFDNQYDKKNVAQVNKNGLAYWRGSVMIDFKDFKTIQKTRLLRDREDAQTIVIEEGGWHFSFLGGIDKIIEKLNAWEHTEKNYTPDYLQDKNYVLNLINQGEDLFKRNVKFNFIPIDQTYPNYILQNKEKFQDYIK